MATNTARRQASTTSLAKFARANSPDPSARSNDFCNSFWGLGDAGVDVLFARMRGAARTMDELKAFWKERAAIEEDYSKRLSRLAKVTLGRDEIGDLRTSFDTLRLETEKQGGYHLQLAQQIRADLEGSVASFCARQAHHKKTFQSVIEKNFKAKQTQEAYVEKARQKYETDCMRINAFTAQATLMQGKELEKVQIKLDRAQQTVQANQRDFANFARALGDTVRQWEVDWKTFSDSCQDLEEDRLEFLKDHLWAFANAIAAVCVSDDTSMEHIRLSLETFEPERDMNNFIRDYSTGNAIPDPPAFVDYNSPDAVPSASARPTTRPADFHRSSQRASRDSAVPVPPQPMAQPDPPQEEPEHEPINQAGLGSGGRIGHQHQGSIDNGINRAQTISRASTRADQYAHTNGTSPAPGAGPQRRPTQGGGQQAGRAGPADANAEPIDPNSRAMLMVGANAYDVDLSRDPQAGAPRPGVSPVQNGRPGVGDDSDPLARQMAELRSASVMSTGSTSNRRSFNQSTGPGAAPPQQGGPPSRAPTAGPGAGPSPSSVQGLATPGQPRGHNYRNSAEFVVGTYPGAVTSSPPNPPTAAFMSPPAQSPAAVPVEEVMANYHQSFPGEGKRNSRRSSFVSGHSPRPSLTGPPTQPMRSPSPNPQQSLVRQPSYADRGRPVSREGHVGIGANGRSTSPFQPVPVSRAASPHMQAQRNSFISPPQGGYGPGAGAQRAASPNSVGIALDPTGKVAVDQMADRYNQQQRLPQQQPQQPQWNQPPPSQAPPQVPGNQNRRISYGMHPGQQQPMQPMQPMQTGYGAPPGPSPMYAPPPPPQGQPPPVPHQGGQVQRHPTYQSPPQRQATQPPQPAYQAPPPQQPQPAYQPPPPPQQAPPAPPVQQLYQPQPQMYAQQNGMQPQQPQQTGYYQQQQQQPQQQPQHQSQASYHSGYGGYNRAPSPNMQQQARSPSPQPPPMQPQPQPVNGPAPTGQYTEDGKPVLFYVKALYDYQATIEEEFDFQAGDIIAVTATPEDGWWSGELLDEQRRQPRRHVFPSNFVCLF